MVQLLQRDPARKVVSLPGADHDQNVDFTAPGLAPGAQLWSKAGWTSDVRHDAAYVELPEGCRFVLVTFTAGHSDERDIIPTVARKVIEGLRRGSRDHPAFQKPADPAFHGAGFTISVSAPIGGTVKEHSPAE